MRTRTIVVAMLVLGTSLWSMGAEAKRPRKRVVKVTYAEPAVGTAGVGVCTQGSSCVFVDPLPGERHIKVKITDDLGLPVNATLIQDTDGDGNYLAPTDNHIHFCGQTGLIRIAPSTVTVWVWRNPGANPPCPGVASSGKVAVTFFKR
jgi:hypothetical protein